MNVLFLGCHCDDIELGCGGTISKFRHEWKIHCHVLSGKDLIGRDLRATCRKSLEKIGVKSVSFSSFRPSNFHEERQEIWRTLNCLDEEIKPEAVFSNEDDEHQDHKILCEEILRNFRRSSVIQYKISRSSSSFSPNVFIELDKKDVKSKCSAILEYEKIYGKNYLSKKSVMSQLRFFGIHPEMDYCESFNAKRIISRKHSHFNL